MTDRQHEDIYSITRPDRKLFKLYLIRGLLMGPAFPFYFLPALFKYETLKYRFDEQGVSMSWGLLWRREINLTYARIQDIHVSRGLIERWLGLATVQIQTASGSGSAEMSIVGLPQYERIRDFLYTQMRGARYGGDEEAVATSSDGDDAAALSEADETVATLLGEIRDDIRAVRARFEEPSA